MHVLVGFAAFVGLIAFAWGRPAAVAFVRGCVIFAVCMLGIALYVSVRDTNEWCRASYERCK